MRSADPVGESSDDQVDPQMLLDCNLPLGSTVVRNASEQHRGRSNAPRTQTNANAPPPDVARCGRAESHCAGKVSRENG